IEKAGDVIPRVVKMLLNLRPKDAKKIIFPKKCPICNSKVVRLRGEVAHYCQNKKCGAIRRSHLYYFVSKKAFDIEGLGPKILDKLMDEGLISDSPDLFLLKEGDLEPLERFAEKAASNIVSAISNSKKITISRLLIACGIKYIGEETAELLAEEFAGEIKNINSFINLFQKMSLEDLEFIDGIGSKVALSIKNWFKKEENVKFLNNLNKVGVTLEPREGTKLGDKLKEKLFIFTGDLDSMPRDKAKERVKLFSGKVTNSVSKNTTYIVVGKNPGSKLEKAKKLGIKILNEKKFLEMIK
ncbi:MAG: helix-hairpin-helix domain-containing protein, partial [Candidatus Pacebacteria bacterium]|nr:helix-hairpin-helix domain-containing protein [Candidatus Paceibacterota bacterium]